MAEDSPRINTNFVSLAGEFAVLSQLALRGYDANMTLGHTKGVDILVSDPNSSRMIRLEVKTSLKEARTPSPTRKPRTRKPQLHGNVVGDWMMGQKHENIKDKNLFYCFVNISGDTKEFRFYILPSTVVAKYVKDEHQLWLDEKSSHSRESTMRRFRIGTKAEKYRVPTPTVEEYEDNWGFNF